jgi:hypothetical protein
MSTTKPILHAKPGDHMCGIYCKDADQRALAVEFVREGIERNEKILYIVAAYTAVGLKEVLTASGIDVDGLCKKGQLLLLTAKDSYLKDGEFKPERMVDLFATETRKALDAGYSALRLTGEMAWALVGEPGSELLVEYEAMLNRFFPNSKCYAICQYDRRLFDAEVVMEVLHTHPKVLNDLKSFDNTCMYFLPPDEFLGRHRQDALLNQYLTNLTAQP